MDVSEIVTRNCEDPLWKTLKLRLDSLPSLFRRF